MINKIFITDYLEAREVFFVRENGVTRIMSLLNESLKEKTEKYHQRFRTDFNIESYRFYFDDTEAINQPDAPNEFHVRHIINVLKTWIGDNENHTVLIHCVAGVSRSTACAFIARRLMGETNEAALDWLLNHRPQAFPNLLILEFADATLGKFDNQEYMATFIGEWKKGTKYGKLVYIEDGKLKEYSK
jgi:predicted protein tyrosine phosphatase